MVIATHFKVFFGTHLVRYDGFSTRLRRFLLSPYDGLCYILGKKLEIYYIDQDYIKRDKSCISEDILGELKRRNLFTKIYFICVMILLLIPIKIPYVALRFPPLAVNFWIIGLLLKVFDSQYWKDHFVAVNYLQKQEALKRKVDSYLNNEVCFKNVDMSTLALPEEVWAVIGLRLGPTDVVHLSKTSRALHTITEKDGIWAGPREKLGLSPQAGLSDKMAVKQAFCQVHLKCQEVFIKTLGAQRILLMPTINEESFARFSFYQVFHVHWSIFRTKNFKQFAINCTILKPSFGGSRPLVCGKQSNLYWLTNKGKSPQTMVFYPISSLYHKEINYDEEALITLLRTGQAQIVSKKEEAYLLQAWVHRTDSSDEEQVNY